MQALVIAQARACAQRARMLSEEKTNQKQSTYRQTTEANLFMHMYNVSSKLLITIFHIVDWFFDLVSREMVVSCAKLEFFSFLLREREREMVVSCLRNDRNWCLQSNLEDL
jgi:hypothetical protein